MLSRIADIKELKVAVERVVRPIRASARRKDRVREELLAHLTAIFEQELAQTKDRESAVAQARRRFGDCEELRRELQASVPPLERVLHSPVLLLPLERSLQRYLAKGENESALHHAGRSIGLLALFIVTLNALVWGLAVAVSLLSGHPVAGFGRHAQFTLSLHGLTLFYGVIYMLLLHGFALAIRHRPLRPRQLLLAGTCCFLTAPLFFACVMMVRGLVGDVPNFFTPHLVLMHTIAAALMPFISALAGLAFVTEARRRKEWGSLVIE